MIQTGQTIHARWGLLLLSSISNNFQINGILICHHGSQRFGRRMGASCWPAEMQGRKPAAYLLLLLGHDG